MNSKAVLIAVAIFGFLITEAMVTKAEVATEARAEAVAIERAEEGPQQAEGRINGALLDSLSAGRIDYSVQDS
ncbi:uncharacterized protein LOC144121541 isoform X2 [Amblyomma americanum]